MVMGKEIAGAALAVGAAIVSNVGTNLQKASHVKDQALPLEQRTAYYKRKSWWCGFVCTIAASASDFAALALASQSLVSAIGGGATLVCNVVVATLFNKERFFWTDIAGVVVIIGGASYFAIVAEPKVTGLDWEKQFFKSWFLLYLAGQVLVILTALTTIASSRMARVRKEYYKSMLAPLEAQVAYLQARLDAHEDRIEAVEGELGMPGPVTGLPRPPSQEDHDRHIDQYLYAIAGGSVGGLSVLTGSISSTLLADGAAPALENWFFYFNVVLMVFTLVVQTHLQNRGLELGDIMAVFPVFEAFWIAFGVISGLVYYENANDDWGDEFKQAAGLPFMIVGTGLLFLHKGKDGAVQVSEAVDRLTESMLHIPAGQSDVEDGPPRPPSGSPQQSPDRKSVV